MWWQKPNPNAPPRPEREPLPFMKLRYPGFAITVVILIVSIFSLATRGLNMGLDFTGGVLIEAAQVEPFDASVVRQQIADVGFTDSAVNLADNNHTAIIRLPVLDTGEDVETVTRQITAALGPTVEIRKTDAVGPKVSGELLRDGMIASLLAVVAIALYIWFRFESKFGWAAFLTTLHDVIAVLGFFSITQLTFDLTIVAGVLTVAGYSINDTVVVFDRIREMLKKFKKLSVMRIIDISITSTLTRTLITSVSTLLATITMILLGGAVLQGFAIAITFGILIGTYSSIFVAAPLLVHLPGRLPGTRADAPAAEKAATA